MGKPITEDAVLQFMREDAYKPLTVQELEAAFGITTAKEFTAFVKLLNRLEDEGKVVRTRTNRYGVPERMNLVRGRLEAHAKGFAFVIPDEPGEPDIYVHPNDVGGAMHGDKVLVRIEKRTGAQRAEGSSCAFCSGPTPTSSARTSTRRPTAWSSPTTAG